MAKMGRPTKYRPDFHPKNFIELSKQGKTFAQIASIWDIDRDSIQEWAKKYREFSVAIKKGRELAESWYINLGQTAMLNSVKIEGKPVKVELGWYVWMTKNMFKWSDRVDQTTNDLTDQSKKPATVTIDAAAIQSIIDKLKNEY